MRTARGERRNYGAHDDRSENETGDAGHAPQPRGGACGPRAVVFGPSVGSRLRRPLGRRRRARAGGLASTSRPGRRRCSGAGARLRPPPMSSSGLSMASAHKEALQAKLAPHWATSEPREAGASTSWTRGHDEVAIPLSSAQLSPPALVFERSLRVGCDSETRAGGSAVGDVRALSRADAGAAGRRRARRRSGPRLRHPASAAGRRRGGVRAPRGLHVDLQRRDGVLGRATGRRRGPGARVRRQGRPAGGRGHRRRFRHREVARGSA